MTNAMEREAVPEPQNPLGIDGIEFIEFATSKPQALGSVLETMGFRPIARHRSREAEFGRARALGAWEIPVRARAMELNIPAIHGVGESLVYFVDRYDEFSIYDIDFRAIPTVDPHPPAQGGMHFFGIVQYIGADRTADWVEFYRQIFGF